MLGALAWQATIIKDVFGVLGGDRTGVGFFGPGFSLPVCALVPASSCCLVVPWQLLRYSIPALSY
jgi:hypothetical protein